MFDQSLRTFLTQSKRRNFSVESMDSGDDMKKALITGVTGQDGARLAELLLKR